MGSYVPNTSRRVLGILVFFFLLGSLCLAVAASSFFPRFSVFFNFFDQIFFEFYFLVSFLYFKELIVAKNYNFFFSALKAQVTKRGNVTAERGNENSQRGNGKIPGFRA